MNIATKIFLVLLVVSMISTMIGYLLSEINQTYKYDTWIFVSLMVMGYSLIGYVNCLAYIG